MILRNTETALWKGGGGGSSETVLFLPIIFYMPNPENNTPHFEGTAQIVLRVVDRHSLLKLENIKPHIILYQIQLMFHIDHVSLQHLLLCLMRTLH